MKDLRTWDRIDQLKTAYHRLGRLVEVQVSRSVVAIGGGRRRLSEATPANLAALDLARRIERTVDDLLAEARELGAGVDDREKIPQPIPIPEAARRLGVRAPRIWELIRMGRLEGLRSRGRTYVIDTDVEDYREERDRRQADGSRG